VGCWLLRRRILHGSHGAAAGFGKKTLAITGMSIAETFWNQRFDMAADQVQAAAKERQHYAVITEEDLAEVFGNGTSPVLRRRNSWKLAPTHTGQAAIEL